MAGCTSRCGPDGSPTVANGGACGVLPPPSGVSNIGGGTGIAVAILVGAFFFFFFFFFFFALEPHGHCFSGYSLWPPLGAGFSDSL